MEKINCLNNSRSSFNQDYSLNLAELEKTSVSGSVKIQVDEELDNALKELELLHDKFSEKDSEQLLVLCKNTVIESITGQFGFASLFIAAKDGGSSTTAHNFKQGITSTDLDTQKFESFKANNDGSREWKDVRKDGGYDKGFHEKRTRDFQTQDVIIDGYTGRPLPKDGRAHIDHIVSAKEFESKPSNHLYLAKEDRAKIATSEKNTTYTEASANQSKGDLQTEDWLDKKRKSGETNDEKYGIDRDMALQKDGEARRYEVPSLFRLPTSGFYATSFSSC